MRLMKHSLLFIALMSTTSLYANIPIESRGLSQSGGSSTNTSSNNASVPSNLNWELMQKNQQLENDIRTLRGQLEEQSNDIEQLKKDLSNRYTDLDQRLELLNQKVDPESAAPDNTSNSVQLPEAQKLLLPTIKQLVLLQLLQVKLLPLHKRK